MTFFGGKQIERQALAKTGLALIPHFLSQVNPDSGCTIPCRLPILFQPQQPPPWSWFTLVTA